MTYAACTFRGRRLVLDGVAYENCVLDNCTLVYRGEQPVKLVDCTIRNPKFAFEGPAANAMVLLTALTRMVPAAERGPLLMSVLGLTADNTDQKIGRLVH